MEPAPGEVVRLYGSRDELTLSLMSTYLPSLYIMIGIEEIWLIPVPGTLVNDGL